METLTNWYIKHRVDGAEISEDEDMFLIQWGAGQWQDLAAPTDLRGVPDTELQFSDAEYQYLDFTRQVFASHGNPDIESDDEAVGMSITLYYAPATGDEPNANLWVPTPDDVIPIMASLLDVPFVQSLLTLPANRTVITVSNSG